MYLADAPSSYQMELLEKEDWRFHAIGPGGTGLFILATSENPSKLSNRVFSFGLPSAPALYLSLAIDARNRRNFYNLLNLFIEHPKPQGIWPEEHTDLFGFFQEFAAEVIFAFTAIEAFANEVIPSGYVHKWTNSRREKVDLNASEIERQVSLDEKLRNVIPTAHNIKSPVGTLAWEKYQKLKKVRDRLIHLKSLDRRASGPEDQTIWGLMIAEKDADFALTAYTIIGAFGSLVKDRRWYHLAGEKFNQA